MFVLLNFKRATPESSDQPKVTFETFQVAFQTEVTDLPKSGKHWKKSIFPQKTTPMQQLVTTELFSENILFYFLFCIMSKNTLFDDFLRNGSIAYVSSKLMTTRKQRAANSENNGTYGILRKFNR